MTVFVDKEKNDHVPIYNGSGSAIVRGQFVVMNGICGVADQDIAAGAYGTVHIEEGIEIQTDDLVTGENTFATLGQKVYWKAADSAFSDTSTAGYSAIGILTKVKDAAGVIRFEKFRYPEVVAAALTMSDISDLGDLKFSDLADVDAAAPTNNDTLKYVSSTEKWTVVAVAD
jgi:predicted RecA/RadA family phage recombinase